jgi:hypothetical protein
MGWKMVNKVHILECMKLIFPLLFVVFVFSCSPKTLPKSFDLEKEKFQLDKDEQYIYGQFKLSFFKSCLRLGANSSQTKQVMENDVSEANDFPLGVFGYRAADSLAAVYAEKIRADSILLFEMFNEADWYRSGEKRVIGICLEGYESYTIDSMAILLAKRLVKRSNY